MLTFEGQWFRTAGAKEQAIADQLDLTSTRYYQILNQLCEDPDALMADPVLIHRLRRLRDARREQRTARRAG